MFDQAKLDSVVYTCPMHPEIAQAAPATCPICGMALEPKTITKSSANTELADMTKRLRIGIILIIPLLVITMGANIIITQLLSPFILAWLQLILATLVIFWCGWPLLLRGLTSIIKQNLNMFTLIGLGVSVAYGYSVFAVLFSDLVPKVFHEANGQVNLYFEAAAVIIILVLLGQVLELRGREKTGEALRALLNLAPKTAIKINSDNQEEEIALASIQKHDLLRILPGSQIPVDGIIITGHGVVDEAMLTGEALPVEKTKDAVVIGGTLNLSGSYIMRAEKVGSDTMLAQIVEQVAAAQRSRAPIQKTVDLIAGYFVPIVLIIAVITFVAWMVFGNQATAAYGLVAAISVLIIACPCALGLATPMSIIVGMGRGAQVGVLIKDAKSLERLEKINLLVVDKTGTLTVGKPVVKNIIALANISADEILAVAASLERVSEHPLAGAIISAAKERQLDLVEPMDATAVSGQGIMGTIKQQRVALGNARFLESLNILVNPLQVDAEKLHQAGDTVIFVAINNTIKGLISIADPIKSTAPAALAALQQAGVSIMMVTGDNYTTGMAIAKSLAITNVEAGVLPLEKNAIIKRLQQAGNIVAMAGDGINDAAALAQADIGIAMGTGTDIAMKSASITLVKGDLMGVVRAHQLSKQVMRNIRQNLLLAFGYNLLCLPIAAGILYPWTGLLLNPMISALAMSLSSVSVIGNALRLRRYNFLNNVAP